MSFKSKLLSAAIGSILSLSGLFASLATAQEVDLSPNRRAVFVPRRLKPLSSSFQLTTSS